MTAEEEIRMAKVIRIDNDVFRRLQEKAIEYRMVFHPPNAVLRRLLDLEDKEVKRIKKRARIPRDQSGRPITS